jgi:ATP-binding cassette subfamily B (MDR/TAP) protein 1
MLKDERNKKAHEQSAQVACEAAGAIRTVASLTREDGCLEEYSVSLQGPLKQAVGWGALSMFTYAFAQGAMFFVMALVFWYGSQLVSHLEISLFQLFIGLVVSVIFTRLCLNIEVML